MRSDSVKGDVHRKTSKRSIFSFFLSRMKLPTVNPKLNMDIDCCVFKDIFHLWGNISNPIFEFNPTLSPSNSIHTAACFVF